MNTTPAAWPMQLRHLPVFDLLLSCGHTVTAIVDRHPPAVVACCDRLGRTRVGSGWLYTAALVELALPAGERVLLRRVGGPAEPLTVLDRAERRAAAVASSHRPGV